MGKVHVGALIRLTYPGRQMSYPKLVYYSEKYFQLKLMNV
jgi:hypothetical protein